MSLEQNKEFVRQQFEEFVNRKNLQIADRNFAPEYQEHGSDAPADYPPDMKGPNAIWLRLSNGFRTSRSQSRILLRRATKLWSGTPGAPPTKPRANGSNLEESSSGELLMVSWSSAGRI